MKKYLSRFLTVVLALSLLLSLVPTAPARAAEVSDLTYEINDGEVTITECDTAATGEMIIPETIEGYPVTAIGEWAFYNCSGLTSVTVPNGVRFIGECAFSDCTGLTSLSIPDTVVDVGAYAFGGCSAEICTSYNGGIYLGNTQNPYHIFVQVMDDEITEFELHPQTKVIGAYSFSSFSELTTIRIPSGVVSIGECAFRYCYSLTSIVIPDSVVMIQDMAFSDCEALASMEIGSGVTSIGSRVFYNTWKLTGITVDEDNAAYCNDQFGVLFNKSKTTLIRAPGTIAGAYTVPDGVNEIGDYAFRDCTGLTDISIPASVTRIGREGFSFCRGLTSLVLPEGVTSIDAYGFWNCSKLKTVVFPASMTSIGTWAFATCKGLEMICFCGDATEISINAFCGGYGYGWLGDYIEATVYYHPGTDGWPDLIKKHKDVSEADEDDGYYGTFTWVEDHIYMDGLCAVCHIAESIEETGAQISGNISIAGEEDAALTLQYADSGEVITTLTAGEGAYVLKGLQPGEYVLTATKEGYVSWDYRFTVIDKHLILNLKLHKSGDVNGDGRLNVGDVALIYAHAKRTNQLTDEYILACADYNGDGIVNVGDTARVYAKVKSK